jgi:hypothetical protein
MEIKIKAKLPAVAATLALATTSVFAASTIDPADAPAGRIIEQH